MGEGGANEPVIEGGKDSDWYDEFWERIIIDDDDGFSAVRLLAEMHRDQLFWRDGDNLVGREGNSTYLTADDQHLVRRIIAASSNGDI